MAKLWKESMTHIRPPVSELAFHLFTRPLHPELFTVNARRVIEFDGAWVEVCVLPTGHWITWRRGNAWASEVASDLAQPLPTSRALFQLKLHQQRTLKTNLPGGIRYESQWTVESLPAEIFAQTHDEIKRDGKARGLLHVFEADFWETPALGHLTVDGRPGLVIFTCFHTFPREQTVVKTLSLLEWRPQPKSPGR